MKKFIVMSGVSGSGKSTYAHNLGDKYGRTRKLLHISRLYVFTRLVRDYRAVESIQKTLTSSQVSLHSTHT
jgi:adenylate kinase family enzyme